MAEWDTSGFHDEAEEKQRGGFAGRRSGWFSGRRRLYFLTGLVSVAIVLAFILSGGEQETPEADAEPPMIRADEEPVRVPPENPGGMDIPHRDKLVYQRLPGEGEDPRLERLLPPPEEPLPPPLSGPTADAGADLSIPPSREPVVAPGDQAPVTGGEEATGLFAPPAGASAPRPSPAAPALTPSEARTATGPRTLLPPEAATNTAPTARTIPSAPPPVARSNGASPSAAGATGETAMAAPRASPQSAAPAPAGGGYMVQLLAVRDVDQARGAWTRLKDRNSDLLGGLAPAYIRADLGAKGVIYRLRAGPLDGEARARTLCAQLARRDVECMIVRPGG